MNIAVSHMGNVERTQTSEEAVSKKGHCRLTAPGAEASYNPHTLYESLIYNTGQKSLTEKNEQSILTVIMTELQAMFTPNYPNLNHPQF